jgi:hypothetical protein
MYFQVEDDFSVPVINNQIQVPSIDILFTLVFVFYQQEAFTPEFAIFSVAESPPPLKTVTFLSLNQSYLC